MNRQKSKIVGAAALLAIAGASHARGVPANITLDPYCDQMIGMKDDGTGLVTGVWSELTACGSGGDVSAAGPSGKNLFGGKGYAVTTDSYPTYGLNWMVVATKDGSGYIVDAAGYIALSGQWSKTVAGVKSQGKSIMSQLAK